MARYSKIFAALDGAATQEAVVRRTLSIAHDNNSEVLFGYVIDSTRFSTGGVGDEELEETNKRLLREKLERYFARSEKDECIPSVELQVKTGDIGEVLMHEFIKPFSPDLIICGARGLSDVKYAFVGSVSTSLVRHAECDVLVVRPEAIEDVDLSEYE